MKFRFIIILGILFSLILTGCATRNAKTNIEKKYGFREIDRG